MNVQAFEWRDIFPFAATLTDTTGMYRYRRVDSSGIVTIRMSQPDQFCAHSFLTTLQSGVGLINIQCSLLRCTDFHRTNHTLLNYLVLSSPEPDNRATTYALYQNYPNPFNPTTTIQYSLSSQERGGVRSLVTLRVFDVLGREVATLVNEVKEAGEHSVTFDARNLPSGVYFYHMKSGTFSATRKLVLMK
ncbi:MAG: T9SS type A sorting domain-containing protein [Bacteroidetes bacterium]|nr:T9SS type A sorting domain-containing protein [Bacteroidota bacterium]MCW5895989.1 T9SS type A sorting domain-containing protein [Bacteroidota bacterium]